MDYTLRNRRTEEDHNLSISPRAHLQYSTPTLERTLFQHGMQKGSTHLHQPRATIVVHVEGSDRTVYRDQCPRGVTMIAYIMQQTKANHRQASEAVRRAGYKGN